MKRIGPLVLVANLSLVAIVLAVWADSLNWDLSDGLKLPQLFPVLGLLAFSLMWLHYVVAAAKRRWPEAMDYKRYYKSTGAMVLALILLHPTLLFIDGKFNGYTVFDYVPGPDLAYVGLGSFALLTFLTYEVFERLQKQSRLLKYWPFVKAVNNVAMLAVFVHGLMLGRHLATGWFQTFWWFMGVTLVLCLIDGYRYQLQAERASSASNQ